MTSREYGGYNVFSADRVDKSKLFKDKNSFSTNLARNALELLLKAKNPTSIFVPYYTCHTVHQVVTRNVKKVYYYHIDENFSPLIEEIDTNDNQMLLVNNYFGVFENSVHNIIHKYDNRIIVDNAQGFFSEFSSTIDKIISPRKFFGVTDGGFLQTKFDVGGLYKMLDIDKSANRIHHLFMSDETSKNASYEDYLSYRESIQKLRLLKMSPTTKAILKSVDYEYCRERREENYRIMSSMLNRYNILNMPENKSLSPMCYPFLSDIPLKKRLIDNKIYIGTYWPLSSYVRKESDFEKLLRNNLCCIPIDQSMMPKDVKYIANLIISFLR